MAASAPLFILSFRHRDELTRLAETAGWRPIAARRSANAETRFVASGAAVAVVDARGALPEGREGVRLLAGLAESNAAALLVLVSRKDAGALDDMLTAGATHFLVSPFNDAECARALLFAARHAERCGGGARRARRVGDEARDAASWRWRPGSDMVELSPALARRAGLGEEDGQRISLMDLFRKLDADGRRAARGAINRLMAEGGSTAFAHSNRGGEMRLAHHMRAQDGGIVGSTETIAVAPAPAASSNRDGRAAREWIEQRLRGEGDDAAPRVIALLLEISRFDAINAAFGRDAGDAVLQAVERRIERLAAPDGRRRLVARIAAAEFAILLSAPATLSEARFLAAQLVDAVARPYLSGEHAITLGSRIGVATSQPEDDAAALLRRASAALVAASNGEAGPIRVLDSSSPGAELEGERLEIDLRRALDKDEIELLFQPQVSIPSGRITGVEALARWRHPLFGELGAQTLFAAAARSDYLVQLSGHVQRKALSIAASWPAALSGLRLAVNITAADIARPGFATQFADMVAQIGFEPRRLTVEVTESGLIEDLSGAAELMVQLRGYGMRVAIDDFGTGYSSLAYLKALPLDYLKLDRRLSQDITGSKRDRVVVRGVIDMARALGLGVIAEGVESETQLGLLAQEGCTVYQGFLCAPPLDSAALAECVAGWPARQAAA